MDFMLEEELIDLMTFCLQNPESGEVAEKKRRITEIGKELYADGGVDALENFFFVIKNRIEGEINQDPSPFKTLWNGLDDSWKF
ncbi:MAG: hypothetical protein NPMRth3_1780003 [Nitrosopumilales archaeon]|nr:MAG: hypothetical protein NPMRth3_1780003 [Nitrosopumilales archaeon]